MCTGLEILAIAGAGASVASATGILGGGNKTPSVVQQSPLADQAGIDADARAKAGQARTDRKRRIRASSLLATGGGGDTTEPITGQPSAVGGKATLGGA